MARNLVNRSLNADFIDSNDASSIDGDLVNFDVEYSTMNTPNPAIIEDAALSNGVDGSVLNYAVEYSTMNTPNPNIAEDHMLADEFYNSSGGGGDDFYDATGGPDEFPDDSQPDARFDGEYSNFTIWSKRRRKGFAKKWKKAGKDIEKGANKFGKNIEKGARQLGKNLEKVGKVGLDALLASQNGGAAAPAMPMEQPVEQNKKGWSGLSTPAKVGIIVGGIAVVSTVAYLVLNKNKK